MFYNETIKLSSKTSMPVLAYGTWETSPKDTAGSVLNAIKAGFRHIDTALAYGNEAQVGEAVRLSRIDREQIFVTTKVPAEVKSVEGAIESIKTSLRNLNLGYIDLLLIHAPMPWQEIRGAKRFFKENLDVWGVMEKFLREGSIKAIGVSNFKDVDLDNIIRSANIMPAVNQIKVHPGSSATLTIKHTLERGVVPMAYSPLGHGKVLSQPHLVEMAQRYGVSTAQLSLKYAIQRQCCPVVKTLSVDHMALDGQLSFTISDDDMKFISALGTMRNLKKHIHEK